MTADELKDGLSEMDWAQKDLAQILCVEQDTVSSWCTGRRPVPGYAEAYVRLYKLHSAMVAVGLRKL